MPRLLLDLPGEVRNELYAYAFVYPYGLQYRIVDDDVGRFFERVLGKVSGDRQTYTARPHPVRYHIQQVCQQLKRETQGLELRHNELHFDTFADLAHFVNNYPKQYFKYLKTTHVAQGNAITGQTSQAGLQVVKEFCAAHPLMTVRAHHTRLSHNSQNIDICAIAYASLFRGSLDIAHKLIDDDGYMCWLFGKLNTTGALQNWEIGLTTETILGASPLPVNLRIGMEEEVFQKWKLHRSYRAHPKLQSRIVRGCQGGMNQWIKVIKELFEEGI